MIWHMNPSFRVIKLWRLFAFKVFLSILNCILNMNLFIFLYSFNVLLSQSNIAHLENCLRVHIIAKLADLQWLVRIDFLMSSSLFFASGIGNFFDGVLEHFKKQFLGKIYNRIFLDKTFIINNFIIFILNESEKQLFFNLN